MKLLDRNLSIGMQGADVKLLHEELRALDFDIPQAEIRESFFREDENREKSSFRAELRRRSPG